MDSTSPQRTPGKEWNTPLKSSRWHVPAAVFGALILFDSIVGGTIAALLQIDGWTPVDQQINNVYQLYYALVVAAALIWLYSWTKRIRPVVATLVLYAGYVEDVLFYLTIPIVNPLITLFTHGHPYRVPSGTLFPERISGWLGWVGRIFLGHNISVALPSVFGIALLAVAVAVPILATSPSGADPANPGRRE